MIIVGLVALLISTILLFVMLLEITIFARNSALQAHEKTFVNSTSLLHDFKIDNGLIDEGYENSFNTVSKYIYVSEKIKQVVSEKIIYISICFFIIGVFYPSLDTAILAYFMEISTNDGVYWNYFIFWTGKLTSYFLRDFINSFLSPYFSIINYLLPIPMYGIAIIIFTFNSYESPRYSFEFSDYLSLTKFFRNCTEGNEIDNLYINPDLVKLSDKGLQNEIERNNQFQIETPFKDLFTKMFCFRSNIITEKIKKQINQTEFAYVTRSLLLRNPLIMYKILMFDKHLRKNLLILLSLTFNIGLIHYLAQEGLNDYAIVNRNDVYYNIFLNQYQVYNTLFSILSVYVCYVLCKYFGYIRLMSISFINIIIFSCAIEFYNLFHQEIEDMNIYTYNSEKSGYEISSRGLLICSLILVNFFATSVYFILFFYIIQFSKTITRCMLFGVCKMVINSAAILAVILMESFKMQFSFVAIAGVSGVIHTYFIYTDFDFSIICDFRKLELDSLVE